jgi:hypothetical protein
MTPIWLKWDVCGICWYRAGIKPMVPIGGGGSWPWSYGSWIFNRCLSPLMLWFRLLLRARCTTLCDKVCQWLVAGRWFSAVPPVSCTNKTDPHDMTEILLKVALNTIKPTKPNYLVLCIILQTDVKNNRKLINIFTMLKMNIGIYVLLVTGYWYLLTEIVHAYTLSIGTISCLISTFSNTLRSPGCWCRKKRWKSHWNSCGC